MPFTLDQQIRMLLYSPDPLWRWLTDDCDAIVGKTGSPRGCPVAQFLRSKLGAWLIPSVYADSVVVFGPSSVVVPQVIVATRPWVHNFVLQIDNGPVAEGRMLLEPVRRDRALEALRKAA